MSVALLLYTRKDCCLCDAMKSVVREAAERFALSVEEIDVDSSALLQERFGAEVPVLFIDGRKAFKYQVTRKALEQILKRRSRRP